MPEKMIQVRTRGRNIQVRDDGYVHRDECQELLAIPPNLDRNKVQSVIARKGSIDDTIVWCMTNESITIAEFRSLADIRYKEHTLDLTLLVSRIFERLRNEDRD